MTHAPFSSAEARAPATVANLGVGFDILGMALAEPADTVIAEPTDAPGVTIAAIDGDGGKLTRDPQRNTAGVAAAFVLKQIGAAHGVRLTIHKGLPLASGLGSSAASAVAGAVAVNALFGSPLAQIALLDACIEGEATVSGRHADNVAPALLGGIVLVTGTTPDAVYKLPVPAAMRFVMATPNVAVPTAEARAVLPKNISLHAMVHQTGAVGRLIAALYADDLEMLGRAMEADQIVEPARSHLMPGLRESRQAAAQVGALATVISGAGPTLCTLCDSDVVAQRVAEAITRLFEKLNLGCTVLLTVPALTGATATVVGTSK